MLKNICLQSGLKLKRSFLFISSIFFCFIVILVSLLLYHRSPPSLQTISFAATNGSTSSLALDGYCPITLVEKQQWVKGDTRWGATHRGRTYLFAGSEEQQRFLADPDRYAPMISGNDVVQALEKGKAVPGMREHGVSYNGHIFLFADEASLQKFTTNPTYYSNRALEATIANSNTAQQMR
jgi:YHS domain-containing protein